MLQAMDDAARRQAERRCDSPPASGHWPSSSALQASTGFGSMPAVDCIPACSYWQPQHSNMSSTLVWMMFLQTFAGLQSWIFRDCRLQCCCTGRMSDMEELARAASGGGRHSSHGPPQHLMPHSSSAPQVTAALAVLLYPTVAGSHRSCCHLLFVV